PHASFHAGKHEAIGLASDFNPSLIDTRRKRIQPALRLLNLPYHVVSLPQDPNLLPATDRFRQRPINHPLPPKLPIPGSPTGVGGSRTLPYRQRPNRSRR